MRKMIGKIGIWFSLCSVALMSPTSPISFNSLSAHRVSSSPETVQAPSAATPPAATTAATSAPAERCDGSHDFDFEFGTWKTHLKRLVHPLTGSSTWVELDGISTVRKVWAGAANMVELTLDTPKGPARILSLRLYDPESHQWSLNGASAGGGTMQVPTVGEFKNGRGEFYDQETFNGRAILVRFVISDITANSCHFEQAFSADGGKTWELNWIATDTRVADAGNH